MQVRDFLQLRSHGNYTGRPQHTGSKAGPAVRNKQARCDANGYGCTECVEVLGVVQKIRVTEGSELRNTSLIHSD